MDLANLKNLDLNDILTKLKSGTLADKKTLIKFGGGFVAILIFLIGYYSFVSPIVNQQKEQIRLMNENKTKIEEFKNNIGTLTAAVKALEPDYAKNSKLFHSKKEVEDLYQNISQFALINGLSITNLKKGEPKAVNKAEEENVMYYKIPVGYEIQGNFLSYLKFRRALSKSQKVINFDKEDITTIAEIQVRILSKGTISILGLPDAYT